MPVPLLIDKQKKLYFSMSDRMVGGVSGGGSPVGRQGGIPSRVNFEC